MPFACSSSAFRNFLLAVLGALAGCATVEEPFRGYLEAPSPQVRDCAQWYAALDRATDESGVRDAQQARVPGFPYLRVDRLLASFRDQVSDALDTYTERLAELDFEARRREIANLPRERLEALGQNALQRTRECGRRLRELDLTKPQSRAALVRNAQVPDDYSPGARILGLYPLTRIPFAAGTRRWEAETARAFQTESNAGPVVRYAPPPAAPMPRGAIAGLLTRAKFDPLRQPLLSEREFAALAAVYAPSFEIAIAGDYDRFGELRWRRGAEVPEVDASVLAVYVHPAYTRYADRVLLQLVYTIWFPERPPRGAVDFLAGRLDGLVWRVTLAPDGEPLVYDSIHPCGCFHLFFPTPRAKPRAAPDALEEWAFAPLSLPRVTEGERPVVRLASATHYIERVDLVRGADSLTRYEFQSYDELRSVRRLDGGRRSVFGPDGLIAGSERLERFVMWPMGIPSAGAMRQWGRHATAFVGRRHFDDADLIERRFELDLAEGP